jgi:rhamnogalacturonyl hydrolase YesR
MNSQELRGAIDRLDTWVQQANWQGYDPFDGLSSPLTPYLTLRRPLLRQVWQQLIRRCPFNLRPLVGIRPATSSKAMGFFALGYLALYETSGEEAHLDRARHCLDWLEANHAEGYSGYCWGNHFDYQSRGGRIAHGVPTIVWTGLIGHAFIAAYELLSEARYLEVADCACMSILRDFGWWETGQDLCLSYTPCAPCDIHNSNMIGASLLAGVYKHTKNSEYLRISERAVRFTVRHQLPSGGWYYGVDPKWHWIDSFHTGYVLESLFRYMDSTGNEAFRESLLKGHRYFLDTFFGADGTPKYYDHKARPLDIQCASQGIQTLVQLRSLDSDSVPTAVKVAEWTIANMQDTSGHFHFRKHRFMNNRTPTLHWGQATMLAALALLNRCLAKER